MVYKAHHGGVGQLPKTVGGHDREASLGLKVALRAHGESAASMTVLVVVDVSVLVTVAGVRCARSLPVAC